MDLIRVFVLAFLLGPVASVDISNVNTQVQLLASRLFFITTKLDNLENVLEIKMQKAIKAQFEEFKSRENNLKLEASQLQELDETMEAKSEASIRKHVAVVYKALSVEKRLMHKMKKDIKADVDKFRTQMNSGLKLINDTLEANSLHIRTQMDSGLKLINDTLEVNLLHIRTQMDSGLKLINDTLEANMQHIRTQMDNSLKLINDTHEANLLHIKEENENLEKRFFESLSNVNDTLSNVKTSIAMNTASINSHTNSIPSLSSRTLTNANSISSHANSISSLSSRISSNYNSISRITTLRSKFAAFYVFLSKEITELGHYKTIVFDTTMVDRGRDYSTTTGIYTAPVSGWYLFQFNIQCKASKCCAMLSEDSTYKLKACALEEFIAVSNSGILHLTKGSKVWVQSLEITLDLASGSTSFAGVLLYTD